MATEIQTDKKATKTIPCTYAGCDTQLVVNLFYAPYKGRCSLHKGKPTAELRAAAATTLVQPKDNTPIAPNGALAQLLCPFCKAPLKIISLYGFAGCIEFQCAYNACDTFVSVKPKWAALVIGMIPPHWEAFVNQYNSEAHQAWLKLKEAREEKA